MKYLSTSALAKELNVKSNELFNEFKTAGLIERTNDQWKLTDLGEKRGGKTKTSPKFGEYIIWPKEKFGNAEVSNSPSEKEVPKSELINATKIAKHFDITSQKMNLVLSELGWIKKDIAGWNLTKQGRRLGGQQFEHFQSGGKYVLWPESLLEDPNLISAFSTEPDEEITTPTKQNVSEGKTNFRTKFPGTHRTKDGHFVRSRGEVIIDDALYFYGVIHAYERKLPVEEDVYCDFFIPSEGVYIEYWGMESDPKYAERKEKKLEIYKKYDFNLIELDDKDIANLDDNLPRKLLKYNIKVY